MSSFWKHLGEHGRFKRLVVGKIILVARQKVVEGTEKGTDGGLFFNFTLSTSPPADILTISAILFSVQEP